MIEVLVQLFIPLFVLGLAYIIGSAVERAHFASIERRERALLPKVTAINLERAPAQWQVRNPELVSASVVVSVDHFKRFLASFRLVFGGRVRSYETLLERGRREALLRLQERAFASGRNAVINVRLESARISSQLSNGKGTTGIEVLAYGTAVVAEVGAHPQLTHAPATPLTAGIPQPAVPVAR